MKKNIGGVDRIVRLLVALLMVIAYFQGMVTGVLGIILMIVALIFVITSLVSICPIYALFGTSTCPPKK
ncbi:MAG: DUF2892 domain-containing protein [Salinivirgaceae bacterium]|jgi:hypothetical protein